MSPPRSGCTVDFNTLTYIPFEGSYSIYKYNPQKRRSPKDILTVPEYNWLKNRITSRRKPRWVDQEFKTVFSGYVLCTICREYRNKIGIKAHLTIAHPEHIFQIKDNEAQIIKEPEGVFDCDQLLEYRRKMGMSNSPLLIDILEAIKTLTVKRERQLLISRFALDDNGTYKDCCRVYGRTLEETSAIFGITKERVRQVEAMALRKLRHPSRVGEIKGYLYDCDNA